MAYDYASATAASIESEAASAIADADVLVSGLLESEPSYGGTLGVLDQIADRLGRVWGETAFLGYVHPDASVREAGRRVEEQLAKWSVALAFRDDVYDTVRRFAETTEAAALDGEQARLLEFTLRDFRKAGHDLDPDDRRRLQELNERLVELGVAFERNIAEDQSRLLLTPDRTAGLPEGFTDGLEPDPQSDGWWVTMAYPHVIPILDNAEDRDLRREVYRLFNNRASDSNREVLEEAVAIREEIARLFDCASWAQHKLEDQMASTPERVHAFYDDLRAPLTEAARDEIDRMRDLLAADTGEEVLQVYDWRYYDTQLRKRDYGVDQSEVAAYFPLARVLDGILDITGEAFDLDYVRVKPPVWHPDVSTYEIRDRPTGERIGHFHMDLYPREGKYSHAAAFPLVPGRRREDGSYQQPVSAIVANFTKPTDTRPSLLLHSEVLTFFHEFGHILHQTLTRAELTRFAGTSTERDFVEAPSQIMEHWVWQPTVLARFARHHQTGEPIPDELVAKLVKARRLNVAITKLRQMQFGLLDMTLHGPARRKDLDAIVRDTTALSLFPFVEGTFYPASFGHLMGGYDAGYYGYLWAEVYGDDMFSRFDGGVDPEVGRAYRTEILERGGTRDALEHIRAFLGREPSNRAFLDKLGID